jgi:hypothetical protein
LETDRFDAELDRVKSVIKDSGEKLDWVDNELMMRAIYESAFGIRNHYGPKVSPLAPVAANPKEDYLPYSSKYRDHAVFIEEKVFEATGMSMQTFFDRPRADIEMDFALVKQKNKRHAAALNAATNPGGKLPPIPPLPRGR